MVNIYKLKLTCLQQEILRLFHIKAGKSLNARAISKLLGVSQPAVAKAIPYLEEKTFLNVKKDKESKRFSIELNRDSQYVVGLKRADNIKQIYESGLVQFLYDKFPEANIILFGSYAFGEDDLESDIDLAIIGAKTTEVDLSTFQKLLERQIIINYYSSFKTIEKNLLNNLLSGILLKGAIELWL